MNREDKFKTLAKVRKVGMEVLFLATVAAVAYSVIFVIF